LTGGRAILEACGEDLRNVTIEHLGRVRKAVIREEETFVVGGAGNRGAIAERLACVKREADRIENSDPKSGSPSGKRRELEKLNERIAALSGKVVTIKVGGISDILMKERLQRVENALNAARMACEEGVLPGGGVGLFRARKALAGTEGENLDQSFGVTIVRGALDEPLRRIAQNSGRDPQEIMFEIGRTDAEFFGLDAKSGAYGDLFEAGVIDPVRVTRLALRNAVGTASSLMTVECAVLHLPPADPSFGFNPHEAAATREDPRA